MKKLTGILLALCALCSLLIVPAAADSEPPVLITTPTAALTVSVDGEPSAALSDEYAPGTAVELTAPNVADKTFQYWINGEGTIVSYKRELSLVMHTNTTLGAVYGTTPATAKPVAEFLNVSRSSTQFLFNVIATAPEGTVTEAGVRYSTTKKTLNDLKGETDVKVEKVSNPPTNWVLDVAIEPGSTGAIDENTTYYAIAYEVVGGETHYSAVKTAKYGDLAGYVMTTADIPNADLSNLLSGGGGINYEQYGTLTFDPNGGEGVMEPQGFVKNEAFTLRANTFTREGYDFTGWNTEANGSGTTYTDGQTVTLNADTTLYAQWRQQTSGGGSGGTVTPTPTPTPGAAYTVPVTGEGTVQVSTEVKDGKAAVADITAEDLNKVTEPGADGKLADTVTIDLTGAPEAVHAVELSKESVKNLTDTLKADNGVDSVTVEMASGAVTLDAAALEAVSEQAKGNSITLVVDNLDQSKLNNQQKEALKQYEAATVFEAYFESNGERISSFNGGMATVALKFTPESGKNVQNYHLVYLNPNGTLESLKTWLVGNVLYAELPHMSEYAIVYDESKTNATPTEPEPQPEPEPEPEPQPTPVNPTYDSLTDTQKKTAETLVNALKVNAETAAQMVLASEKLGVSADTMKLDSAAILALKDDADPKGSDFAKMTARATKRTNTAITLQWKKQKNADGYLVFGAQCGKPYKLLKTIKKNSTVKWTQKNLKKGKNYKYLVVAYKNVNGEKMTIAASVVVHSNTKGGKVTVAKSLTVKQGKKAVTKLTIKKGKSVTIKPTEVKEDKKLKIKSHRAVKFESSNKKVAKVSKSGKITGVKKGTATIYIYAQNGIYKTVKVTVK